MKIGPVRVIEKKRTRQDSQKVTKALYLTYLGRSSHWTDLHQNLQDRCCPRCNYACKVWNWNVEELRFYRGRIFGFPIDSCMCLTTMQRYCDACDIKQVEL